MSAQEQVVIVGGTKGLGRLLAERFIAQGHAVTVLSRTKPDGGLAYRHIAVDLEALVDAAPVVEQVVQAGGKVRYLVFCQRYRGTGDAWQGEMQVTLNATRLLINGFADQFCDSGDRAIAVVSSVYAQFVGGSQPDSYHVAKAGLNQLVKFHAWGMGRRNVRINAIMPLSYLKDESRRFVESNQPLMQLYHDFVPLKRIGEAADSANLVEFLCSDKAAFINGQSIFVDGGVSVVWPEELARTMAGFN
ncbi:SDR family oxidoreductase [Pseudoduganella ginsengisoli]|uniref:SDR family oxidoreductase n=1 Tax=Pseudoduganella ginsengisoli TaxID=1462440 RepID=A0A6L6PZG1_9BURK|nr:SDR family oxidoreductase [Pseudoduganella ginsengisoli]MTW02646.1 SDR family oxidoreductase [Pseudoduganella ginsengisoli]